MSVSKRLIQAPMYYIQCDWEDHLNKISGEIWVSCKYKEQPSKHGKLVRMNICSDAGNPAVTATEDFNVNLLTHNAIQIGLKDSKFSCIFLAPRSIYSSVHKKSVTSLDIVEGSSCVSVSVDDDSNVAVWLADGEHKLITFTEHVGTVYKCRWFPSGKVILSYGADMNLKIWCSETGRCPVSLKGHKKAITDSAFVDRGRNIVSVSKDGVCKLWDCGEAICIDNLLEINCCINCCSISTCPNNYRLPESGSPPHERESGTDDKIVLTGSEEGDIHCIGIRSRKVLFSLKLQSAVNCCCCIKPGIFVAGCQDGSIHLISVENTDHIITSWLETNNPALSIMPYQENGFFVGHNDGSCVYRSIIDLDSTIRLNLTGPDGDPIYDICCDNKFIYTACRDSCIRKYSPDSYIVRHFQS